MQSDETQAAQVEAVKSKAQAARFTPARDTRKRKIRGLWIRNGKYYAQMRVDQGNGTTKPVRIPLSAKTLDGAKAESELKRTEKAAGGLHLPGHRPKFFTIVEEYQTSAAFLSKKLGTRKNEKQALARWTDHVGGVRVDWIKADAITTFHDKRRKGGVSSRTVNLDTTAFNNAMRYAHDRKWISVVPKVKKLKETKPPRRPLLLRDQIESILKHADVSKNAAQFRFYVRFLVSSGAREKESLRVRKEDVHLERGVVRVGADGDTKNLEGRDIQLNAALRGVLEEMLAILPHDTEWLFPSPQRGQTDAPAKTFRESLRLVRAATGLPWVGFHDFRHYFASRCVMTGLDYMTIAEWLGHQDGGILVAKVYGHLNDAHQKSSAAKLIGIGDVL